jgi:hypothetical protein
VAQLFWAESARAALDDLVLTHSLPGDTHERIAQSLRPLARFPRLGPEIQHLDDGQELRFLIGPWPWLLLVYVYDPAQDRVVVVSPEDGRAAISAARRRR